MSVASDWVSSYRQDLGLLLQVRERLRARHRILDKVTTLLDEPDAFAGTNADLAKADVTAARTVLDAVDADQGLSQGETYLQKVAGQNAFPRV